MRPFTVIYLLVVLAILAITLVATAANGQTPEQVKAITKYSKAYGIDPDLALSVAQVESNFDPNVVGALGEKTIFQLRPQFHKLAANPNDRHNIELGVRYLAHSIRMCTAQYGDAAFVCFNRGPNAKKLKDPRQTKYYQRVIAIYIERKATSHKNGKFFYTAEVRAHGK